MADNLIYGPVPSRRLGLSLGVDLVPYKICSYNCIYCQIGPTRETTIHRKSYIGPDTVLLQLFERLDQGVRPDYITLGGSGEPTLNSNISDIIIAIKSHTDIPVAVLTNGSLFGSPEVRNAICKADVVLPSFDACDEQMFLQVNRPHKNITFAQVAKGLDEFRKEYAGDIWLEIFIVKGINNTVSAIKQFKQWTDRFSPDKIHLNTAVRPTAERNIQRISEEELQSFCDILGKTAEVIAPFKKPARNDKLIDLEKEILKMLGRRPCTLDDIANGLGLHPNEILKYIDPMVHRNVIHVLHTDHQTFYRKMY